MRTKRFTLLLLMTIAASLLVLCKAAIAHHSTAEFDMASKTSVKGTVTKFEWGNPHAYIYMQAKDEKGATVEWSAEMPSIGMLSRINWKRDTLKPGDEITIFGNRARDGRTVLRVEKVILANGQEMSAVVG